MKIAVYYDTLINIGGAERVAIELANGLNADLITSGYDKKINEWLPIKNKVINLGNFTLPIFNPFGTLFEAPFRFFLARHKLNYDKHIFIGFSSIYASVKGRDNYWFCLTPNRMLYDLKEVKQKYNNIFARLIFAFYAQVFTKFDQHVIKNNLNHIICQNEIIQKRVKKYYDKDSSIIHSPINADKYYFEKFGNFFLCVSRLFYEKRVDIIARAFTLMPNKDLVIIGSGPEEKKIKDIIFKFPNIQLITNCSENELIKLYANCLATIYMPLNEDFGLSPLEGMASGKACIAADEGGLTETIINGKTGYRILPNETAIIKSVLNFSQNDAERMKASAIAFAWKYDISSIINEWKKVGKNALFFKK